MAYAFKGIEPNEMRDLPKPLLFSSNSSSCRLLSHQAGFRFLKPTSTSPRWHRALGLTYRHAAKRNTRRISKPEAKKTKMPVSLTDWH
jgi:hypothetical protein